MYKSKLAHIIDSLIISLLVSIITFIWSIKLSKNAILSKIILIFVFLSVFIAIFIISNKRYKISKIKFNDTKKINQFINFFKYSSLKNYIDYFEKLFSAKYFDSYIFVTNDNIFYINLKSQLTDIDFASANNFLLSDSLNKKLIFIYLSKSNSFDEMLSNSPNKFFEYHISDLYEVMRIKQLYPPINFVTNQKKYLKQKLINLLSNISKNYFKDFLFTGISLLTISFFIPFSRYYLIFGSIFLLLSIISLFRKSNNLKVKKVSLFEFIKK